MFYKGRREVLSHTGVKDTIVALLFELRVVGIGECLYNHTLLKVGEILLKHIGRGYLVGYKKEIRVGQKKTVYILGAQGGVAAVYSAANKLAICWCSVAFMRTVCHCIEILPGVRCNEHAIAGKD